MRLRIPEAADKVAVACDVGGGQVLQEASALADHGEESAPGMVVVLVGGKVVLEAVDARGQQSDLDFRRAGVSLVGLVLSDDLVFLIFEKSHMRLLRRGERPLRGTRASVVL